MLPEPSLSETGPILCLINWETSSLMVDDGSYLNWLEGMRTLEAAIGFLPLEVLRLATEPYLAGAAALSPARLSLEAGLETLRRAGAAQVLVAGNSVEHDVTPFAEWLAKFELRPVILFDVCGTLDPMAKWQSLARAVDRGVMVSTVQQALGALQRDMLRRRPDSLLPDLSRRLGALLGAAFGEHAGELSAA